jgi:uncharacterized protein YcfJ
MNQKMIVGLIVGAAAVTAVGAVAGYRLLDDQHHAQVVAAVPAFRTVSKPGLQCRDEVVNRTRPMRDPHQSTGTAAGAVVGGVPGSKVGDGDGNKLATVGGAVAGGYGGNKIQEGMQNRNTHQDIEHVYVCERTSEKHQEPAGYNVTYRLNGQQRQFRLAYDPGDRIPVENGELVVRR